jgi:hypothetical protein
MQDEGLSKNAASLRVGEDTDPDHAESIARHLRTRLQRERSEAPDLPGVAAGALAILDLLEQRIDACGEEIASGSRPIVPGSSTDDRLKAIRTLLEERIEHLRSLDRDRSAAEAESILGRLPELDHRAEADSLLVLERRRLEELLSRVARIEGSIDHTPF